MNAPLELIDFHCHHVPAQWTPTTTRGLSGAALARWERINRRLADRAALFEFIESGDIQARVLNIPSALFTEPGATPAPEVFPRINEIMAEIVAERPQAIIGLASVDAFGGDAAARELERAVKTLGLRGVYLDSQRGDLLLDSERSRPVLQAAAALDIPVFAHPISPEPLTGRLSRYGNAGVLYGRGTSNGGALLAMLESGVFDELPTLRVVFTTLGINALFLAREFGREDAAAILRRNVYIDTLGLDPVVIRASVDMLGVEHVVAGSDWPVLNDAPIRERITQAFEKAGLTAQEQALVAGGNTRGLFA